MGILGMGILGALLLSGSNDKGFENVTNKEIVTVGKWNNEPIEWIVLKNDEKGKLLLSVKVLFNKRFNEKRRESNWKTSDIRKYLNEVFWESAFDQSEKNKIVNNYKGSSFDGDRVFLLSWQEAENLLQAPERATPNKEYWILRTMSYSPYYVSSVSGGNGHMFGDGQEVNSITMSGIRPAIYLK